MPEEEKVARTEIPSLEGRLIVRFAMPLEQIRKITTSEG
jgi:hypothetical protein